MTQGLQYLFKLLYRICFWWFWAVIAIVLFYLSVHLFLKDGHLGVLRIQFNQEEGFPVPVSMHLDDDSLVYYSSAKMGNGMFIARRYNPNPELDKEMIARLKADVLGKKDTAQHVLLVDWDEDYGEKDDKNNYPSRSKWVTYEVEKSPLRPHIIPITSGEILVKSIQSAIQNFFFALWMYLPYLVQIAIGFQLLRFFKNLPVRYSDREVSKRLFWLGLILMGYEFSRLFLSVYYLYLFQKINLFDISDTLNIKSTIFVYFTAAPKFDFLIFGLGLLMFALSVLMKQYTEKMHGWKA